MAKKKRSPFYVKPQFKVGEVVELRGERCVVESIHGLNSGNRPKYKLDSGTIYPEQFLRKIPRRPRLT